MKKMPAGYEEKNIMAMVRFRVEDEDSSGREDDYSASNFFHCILMMFKCFLSA